MRGVGSSVKSQTTQFVKRQLQRQSNIAWARAATEERFFSSFIDINAYIIMLIIYINTQEVHHKTRYIIIIY